MNKIPNNTMCILPWISLETSPLGTVRPCCLALDEIVDDQGQKFRLGQTSLAEIQNSDHMRDLRRQFLAGQRPETCQRCWDEEDSGRISKRMHTIDRLKHVDVSGAWTEDAKPLIFLDFKLGNICNLKCRICGSWSSSTYATEEYQATRHAKQKLENYHYVMLKQGEWPRKTPDFWQDLQQQIHNIRYMEFTGGEPFMIQEHFDLLRYICEHGCPDQVEIHYNTNGTQWPAEAEEIWRQFRVVEIAFSIDALEKRFEYQRSGARWDQVKHNIDLYRQLRQRSPNIRLQVCSTVSIFNVLYLEELANWIDQQGFDYVYWNMLHEAPEHNIKNAPAEVKDLARQRLLSARVSEHHRGEFANIINFMDQGTSQDSAWLIESIRRLDLRRQENLAHAHPELAKALNYEK